ncbi:CDGSH iron-sulfur domain-containing protein 2 isoform X1 [Pteropus medius]|uniref:CDGSH iron-sulfur domain-containing protein 2 isoform X1 n=1 Tax=Pteropus vampyrus TaxID=132908 RepID=UPI00196A46FA|nr:CDGSH iron-sulfur domain-containing protein 2 isoform X1 [Pteropus giganteus]
MLPKAGAGWGSKSLGQGAGRSGAWRVARDPVTLRAQGGGSAPALRPESAGVVASPCWVAPGACPHGNLWCPSVVRDQVFSREVSEWLRLLPFLGVLALLGYLAVRPFLPKKKQQKDSLINLKIQKENPKVVNEINIEDLCLTKAAYCRCWRSKTFPACDGSHNKHNELTGDNVGPLILKKKEV